MDYTNYLFLGIICAVVALVAVALTSPGKATLEAGQKRKRTKQPAGNTDDSLVVDLKAQQDALSKELEKAASDNAALKKEAEQLKKSKADLEAALVKRETWDKKGDTDSEKLKKENALFKQKLTDKAREIEKEITQNFQLGKELKEKKEKLESALGENKGLKDELRKLEAQVSGCQKELQEKNKAALEAKKKEQESEWVSKKEYNELKERLEEKESATPKQADKPAPPKDEGPKQ